MNKKRSRILIWENKQSHCTHFCTNDQTLKLDFLYDMTDDGKYPQADPVHLLRLFDFTREEALQLSETVAAFAGSDSGYLSIHELDFIQADDVQLHLQKHQEDLGILMPQDMRKFKCLLQPTAFHQMADLIRHFADKETDGYQWLYDPKTDGIDLLFSPGGTW